MEAQATKLLFVGDAHLDSITPISRTDNYRELTLDKLQLIKEKAIQNKCTHIVMTGDMFENLDQSLIYLNKVLDAFRDINNAGLEVYSIVGNHDLPNNSFDKFPHAPLYTLFRSGLVKHFSMENPVQLSNNTYLYGLDYTKLETFDESLIKEGTSILTAHYATDNTIPSDDLPFSIIEKFNLVVLGHDHHYYKPMKVGKTVVLRPGSMTRRTKELYNLEREIPLYIYDCDSKRLTTELLPIKPAVTVFKNEVFNDRAIDFYKSNYGELFTEEYFESGSVKLSDLIEELPDTVFPENKKAIKEYFKNQGIIID